tara:strand:- start:1361 stop:1837 length:477 start_codon:yes stop_codon:yes gene_type:complete
MPKSKNAILFIILFLLIFSISAAYFIEHGLGYKPCKLCLYQRMPYFFSIILILNILFIKKFTKITLLILCLTFVGSTILAFYHFGIEQGFFNESFLCKDSLENLSKDELLKELQKINVSCKDVNFRILGLSIATINAIFSFCLSAIFIKLFNNYEKNR